MRKLWAVISISLMVGGCSRGSQVSAANAPTPAMPEPAMASPVAKKEAVGFDRNDYPGDATMAGMQKEFAFTGYWLTNPPGESANSWVGKREVLKRQGWGFLVLANGKLEAEILKAQKAGTAAAALGKADAAAAVAAAKSEGFPARTILFLDQEEGGRLTDPQAGYLLAWTEAVAASEYRPGVYASGQRTQDGPGQWIDTVEDIRERVTRGHLHEVAIFDAQDQCPPAPGCTVQAKPLAEAGEPDLVADGMCYAPGFPTVFLDMDAAKSSDPSNGR